jgi:hypothetical protein
MLDRWRKKSLRHRKKRMYGSLGKLKGCGVFHKECKKHEDLEVGAKRKEMRLERKLELAALKKSLTALVETLAASLQVPSPPSASLILL